MKKLIKKDLAIKTNLIENLDILILDKIINKIKRTLKKKKNFFLIGNGGSASTADHVSCDFMKRFKKFRPRFISLCSNNAIVSAISNDDNFDKVFSGQIETLGNKEDLLIIFSASGNSPNLINAAFMARKRGLCVISFCGNNGGKLSSCSNLSLNLDSKNYGIIEDLHLNLMHLISDFILKKPNLIK